MYEIVAVCVVITALLAYVNQRYFGLPTTIGVMVTALGLSLLLVALDAIGLAQGLKDYEQSLLRHLDFSDLLMQGMLSLLLFAGALQVDLGALRAYRWQVGALAVIGTAASTVLIGAGAWWLLPWLGVPLPLLVCMVFGALISPTDPIAVIGILKSAGAPRELEVVMAGESLFNDGVGIVLFSLLVEMLANAQAPTLGHAAWLLLREAGGGLLLGYLVGQVTFRLLRSIDHYQVEVLLTLAAVLGGYALASRLHVSGPLAMVAAGLLVGHQGRALAMSDTTRHHVDLFWELIDEILNAVLFVLIGMEVVLIHFMHGIALAAVAVVALTLLARWVSVGLPVEFLRRAFKLPAGAGMVLTWGGLRGGISVALCLSLPYGTTRNSLLALTYCVVVFSILCQGLTIGRVVRCAAKPRPL